jgi:isoleucyl-tRNA synthetase
MSKSLGNGIEPQAVSQKLGAEIIRLWVAASDYSGDIAGDDKILARVVDGYRRIRNTLRFLLANTSDFDPEGRRAGRRAAGDRPLGPGPRLQLQAEVLAHYERYEFHPVVAKLQVYCSEDLGAFYLDVLKDRLYTTAPKSLARRSAQTALWHITHAMLRWMAPFLSFTAEEAWKVFAPQGGSIFTETYWPWARPTPRCWPSGRASAPSARRSTRPSRPCAPPAAWVRRCRPRCASAPRPTTALLRRWATT